MNRTTQNRLYHLLPVAAWLLAIGGMAIFAIYHLPFTIYDYVPAVLVLTGAILLRRIPRHGDSVEPCFVVALLLGVAAYWLPSVVFLMIPAWGYLIYRNLFGMRPFLASIIGLATVAIWVAVGNFLSLFTFHFSIANNLFVWIPTGAVLFAWLTSTIVRQTLRER